MSLGSSSAPDPSIKNETRASVRSSFEIGDWLVEPDRLRVVRGEDVHKLEPMAMRLLVFLAARPGQVLSRVEILREVWEGRAVVDETLSRGMSLVRQALGDDAQNPSFIETIPRRGYRVVAPVRRPSTEPGRFAHPAQTGPITQSYGGPRTRLTRRTAAVLAILLVIVLVWWGERVGQRAAREAAPAPPVASEAPQRQGIAVLPFKNLSPDPTNAYLSEGLTEELIHQLASVSGLRVVSRTSSMNLLTSDASAPEIAKALNVDYLLEGTVLVVGQRLRITARLIRPDQNEDLMSGSYDRDFSEVLDLQREVAKDVVRLTRTKLSLTEANRLTRDRSIDSAAYRTYLQGLQVIQQRSEITRGLDLLERAVELDPSFAPAWAALADAHLLSNSYLGQDEDSAYAGAEAAIGKALELDPELAPAHTALGLLRLQRDRDWPGSEASYRRAIEHEPSYVTARQWYSELLSLIGRHAEALDQIGIALELDPLSPLIHAAAAQRLSAAGRYHEALSGFQDAEALGADFPWLFREKAWALGHLGRDQESLEILVDLAIHRGSGLDARQIAALERATQEQGLLGYHTWAVRDLLARDVRPPGFPTWVAAAYSGAGQPEEAFRWLAKAVVERNLWLVHTLRNPAFDVVRDDPRFVEILGDIPPWQPEIASRNRTR